MAIILQFLLAILFGIVQAHRRVEENVCCGPLVNDFNASRCCGQGWGIHCCRDGVCCYNAEIFPKSVLFGAHWEFKHWANWLNIGIVAIIVVSAVLICWCASRKGTHYRQNAELFSPTKYGAVLGVHPNAPEDRPPAWSPPMSPRWVGFTTQKEPSTGTPLNSAIYHQPPQRVRKASESSSDYDQSSQFSSSDEEAQLLAKFQSRFKPKVYPYFPGQS